MRLPGAKPPPTLPPSIDDSTVRLEWPDDGEETTALPITAFQVVGPEHGGEDDTPPEWPHPSTWEVPGTQWEDLNDPTPDPPYPEDSHRNNGNK